MANVTIPYEPSGFNPTDEIMKASELECRLGELVHAAITVGKDRNSFRRMGRYARFEALYKLFHVKAYLDIYRGGLRQTSQFRRSDPSEKGAISYYFGLMMAKLFAERFLDTPWLLNLDSIPKRDKTFKKGCKEKPDLVGLATDGRWIVVETKGRSGPLPDGVLTKAKKQLDSLDTIYGQSPMYRIVSAVYFRSRKGDKYRSLQSKIFNFESKIVPGVVTNPAPLLQEYYAPFLELVQVLADSVRSIDGYRVVLLNEADVVVGVNNVLFNRNFSDIRRLRSDLKPKSKTVSGVLEGQIYEMFSSSVSAYTDFQEDRADNRGNQPITDFHFGEDGIFVVLGPTWRALINEAR